MVTNKKDLKLKYNKCCLEHELKRLLIEIYRTAQSDNHPLEDRTNILADLEEIKFIANKGLKEVNKFVKKYGKEELPDNIEEIRR